MTDATGFPADARENRTILITLVGAATGAAVIYFLSTDRGRRWLRDLPEAGRSWASTVRQGMALVREIAEQIEQSVNTFEQALGRIEHSVSRREIEGPEKALAA